MLMAYLIRIQTITISCIFIRELQSHWALKRSILTTAFVCKLSVQVVTVEFGGLHCLVLAG